MDTSAPETVANVTVVLTSTDGSTNVRNTYWVYEGGSWLHRFSAEEYDLLASTPTGSSSASPSASASASATSAQGNPYGCPDDRPIPATRAGDPGEGSLRCFATRSEANAYSQGTRPAAPGAGGDITCEQVNGPIRVPPGDPNNLDGDGDGWACE